MTCAKTIRTHTRSNNKQSKHWVKAAKANTMANSHLHNNALNKLEHVGGSPKRGGHDHGKHTMTVPTHLLAEYDNK